MTRLGELSQSGGKTLTAFPLAGDFDPAPLVSNRIGIEWLPLSGRRISIPEVHRGGWWGGPKLD